MRVDLQREFDDFSDFLSTIESWDLPTFKDELYRKVDHFAQIIEKAPNKEELKDRFFQICDKFASGPLHRRAREKPLGYAGDFLIIDWIYTQKTASSGKGKFFDLLFQSYEAAQAVRNRKQYFINKCAELAHQKNSRIDILNLGCGPCRDILETVQTSKNGSHLHFHCIDNEPKAIEYAKKLLAQAGIQNNILLDHANVLRFRTSRQYDLIWVAGLFDYLEDRAAVLLLKKIWKHLKDDGQIIFGNFSPGDPTRQGMELVARWKLIHRNASDLIRLCREAGLPFSEIEIESEPLGVNLFCIVRK